MFALGHKRILRQVNAMSALPPPKADILGGECHARKVPKADIRTYLFDHFVGALLELQGYLDALGFRCLKLIIK
jgi:hypothetical protein